MLTSCIRIALSREAIIAFCLGVFFPVLAFVIQAADSGYPLNIDSVVRVHRDNILIWIPDAAPLILWAMACVIAAYRNKISEHIEKLVTDRRNTQLILDSAADGIFITNALGIIVSGNRAAHKMFGYSVDEFSGKHIGLIRPPEYMDGLVEKFAEMASGDVEPYQVFDQQGLRKDGSCFSIEFSVSLVGDGLDTKVVLVVRDVSERATLEEQLNQAQKLESIGQLAAGIAHEINTPIQYVNDNMRTISEYLVDIESLSNGYQQLLTQLEAQNVLSEQVATIRKLEQECDLEFMLEDAPAAMLQSLEGITRVSEIVKAMKNFSPSGSGQVSLLDINEAISNTLIVARNEYKYIADIETNLAEIPLVECHAGELNQVFLNLIVNAAHAIEEKGSQRGLIRISTSVPEPGYIEVCVSDNGCGIPEEVRHKVFDPFFTTKEVGKGTGQGLNLAFQTIERKHNGRIFLDTRVGEGTQFRLKIPERVKREESHDSPIQAVG